MLNFVILSSSKTYWWYIALITVVQKSPTLTAQPNKRGSSKCQASSCKVLTVAAALPLQTHQDLKHDLSKCLIYSVSSEFLRNIPFI